MKTSFSSSSSSSSVFANRGFVSVSEKSAISLSLLSSVVFGTRLASLRAELKLTHKIYSLYIYIFTR